MTPDGSPTPEPSGTGAGRNSLLSRIWFEARRMFSHVTGPLLGLIVVLVVFTILLRWRGELEYALQFSNLQAMLHQYAVPGIVALGMLLIVISGGIDLSVGSVVALVTVVTMQTYKEVAGTDGAWLLPSLVAVLAGVGVGTLCGFGNGLLITQLRVTPFVVTLGTFSIARGLSHWLAGRHTITFEGPRPPWVTALAMQQSKWLVFDPGVWTWAFLAVGVAILLRYTVFGRYCYAIGSNEAAARLCGIGVERNKVLIYTLAGALTGLAGVLQFAHGFSGDPNAGKDLALDVIAAVVIGGASLTGGQGNVSGTLLGILILGVVDIGVSFLGVEIEVKYIVIGAVLIGNMALSHLQQRTSQ